MHVTGCNLISNGNVKAGHTSVRPFSLVYTQTLQHTSPSLKIEHAAPSNTTIWNFKLHGVSCQKTAF